MRSNTATTGKVRLVIVLSLAAAVTVMLGVILVATSVVIRLVTKQQPPNMTRLGLDMFAAGIAFGLVVLVVFAMTRIGTGEGPRTSGTRADHRRETSRPQPAASSGPGESAGHGVPQGSGQERARAGSPSAGGERSARRHVLKPTNVYSPGGLIDVPREGRAPGTPGGQNIPEILRTAGPPPVPGAPVPGVPVPGVPVPGAPVPGVPAAGAPGGGWGQDRPAPAWARTHPPQPGYQPGSHGRGAYAPGGPPPPIPSREHMRPQETPRPGHAMQPREPVRPREPVPPRGAAPSAMPQAPRPGRVGPPRDSRLVRDAGPPREGMAPGGPIRPGGPMPARDPGYPPPPGQGPRHGSGVGAGRSVGSPGYAAPGGHRPGPGHAGSPGPAEASQQFDGGYAKVIRASDQPVRPSAPGRPPSFGAIGDPARPSGPGRLSAPVRPPTPPADVYVYRDTDGLPGDSGSPATGPDENDSAYWYDLPGTGPERTADSDQPGGVPHGPRENRGPFEPLVSSAGPPGTSRTSADAGTAASADAAPALNAARPAEGDPGGAGHEESAHARKLEQIKDLYLTAEAIGVANVDKHFDQLLAQQRELISDYFKRPADTAGPAEDEPGRTRPPGGPAGPAEGAPLAADQPRAW